MKNLAITFLCLNTIIDKLRSTLFFCRSQKWRQRQVNKSRECKNELQALVMRVSLEKVNELGSGHLYQQALLEKTTSVLLLQGRPDPERCSMVQTQIQIHSQCRLTTPPSDGPKLPNTSCPGGTFHTGRQVSNPKTHSIIPQTQLWAVLGIQR